MRRWGRGLGGARSGVRRRRCRPRWLAMCSRPRRCGGGGDGEAAGRCGHGRRGGCSLAEAGRARHGVVAVASLSGPWRARCWSACPAGRCGLGQDRGVTSASVPSLRELWPYAETPLRRTRQIVGDGRGADLVCVVVANRERGARPRAGSAGRRAAGRVGGHRDQRTPAFGGQRRGRGALAGQQAGRAAAVGGGCGQRPGRCRSQRAGRGGDHGQRPARDDAGGAVGLVLAWWLLRRARWTTAAWADRRLRCTREGLQVLGVRAAATAPLGAVGGALHPHAGGGGMDQHTLEVLGSLELDRLGLRRPPRS